MTESGRAKQPTGIANHRAWVVGIALAAVISVGAVTVASLGGSPGTPTARTTPQATPTESAGPSGASSNAPPASSPPASSPPAATPPTATPPSQGTPTTNGTNEQQQPGTTGVAVVPPPPPLASLYTGPLPAPASAVGKLVVGFPAEIPLAQGSVITDSSVSSSDGILQAALVAHTPLSAPTVIAFYQSELAKVNLQVVALPAIGGSLALGFTRDGSSITLTVTASSSGGSTYTVLGVLRSAA